MTKNVTVESKSSTYLTFCLGDNDFSSVMLTAAMYFQSEFGSDILASISDESFKTAMVELMLGFHAAKNVMRGWEQPTINLREYFMDAEVYRTREAAERDCNYGAVSILLCPQPHVWLH